MRRTFQDLKQRHYSTVSAAEMRSSLAKVIDLAGIRKVLAA
jgi:hypothetical protein